MKQQECILLFSLGPVQSFIAQARKTRDLWLGSFLLSTLIEAGMEGIDKNNLVFPYDPKIKGNIPDLPNKYIAILNNSDEAKACAERSERQIKGRWESICNDVWNRIIKRHGNEYTSTIWNRQVNPDIFFEIFWVIVDRNEASYGDWLESTQEALAARKRLRPVKFQESPDFLKEEVDEPGEKSTISGEREALRGTGTSRDAVRIFWKGVAEDLSVHDLNKEGEERLDAIDTAKRFAHVSQTLTKKGIKAGFPSTSSIATASFVEGLLRHDIEAAILTNWFRVTKKPLDEMEENTIPYLYNLAAENSNKRNLLKRDGDCYFLETFTAYRLKKNYVILQETEERAVEGKDGLRKLLQAADTHKITRPTPYYAMIQMDGDRMGTLLSSVTDKQEHKNISKALSAFSRELVPSIVQNEQYPGRLVYAGGDDVFALAPLVRNYDLDTLTKLEQNGQQSIKTFLDLVDQLQQEYCKEVRKEVRGEERKQKVTASVGVAIAHHYTSLSYVRRVSKDAEELAKKHYGRNTLVVTLLRRSGEQTRVGCRWRYDGLQKEGQPIRLFTHFYELFKQDVLSPKCVYNLLEEASTLVELNKNAQQSEVKRMLKRQRNSAMEQELSNDKVEAMAKHLVDLAEAMDIDEKPSMKVGKSIELHSSERRYGLVEVLGWLLVMVFLARKEQE